MRKIDNRCDSMSDFFEYSIQIYRLQKKKILNSFEYKCIWAYEAYVLNFWKFRTEVKHQRAAYKFGFNFSIRCAALERIFIWTAFETDFFVFLYFIVLKYQTFSVVSFF